VKERNFVRDLCLITGFKKGAVHYPPSEMNWSWIVKYAIRHGLAPLFWSGLGKLDERFSKLPPVKDYSQFSDSGLVAPPDLLNLLQECYYSTLRRNFLIRSVLDELDKALEGTGIICIVWKGGALAFTVYPHPALRPMDDLDILIAPESMADLEIILKRAGFKHRSHYPLVWDRQGAVLDLHPDIVHSDRISNRIKALPMTYKAHAAHSRSLLDYRQIKTLSFQDTLISSAVHAMKHSFIRDIWLADSFYLLNSHPELWEEPDGLLERAEELNAILPLSILISIMGTWPGCPDSRLLSEIRSRYMGFIPRSFLSSIVAGNPIPFIGEFLFCMSLQTSLSRILYVYEFLFPSRKVMEQIFNKRKMTHYWLYYPLRILILLKKAFRLFTVLIFFRK